MLTFITNLIGGHGKKLAGGLVAIIGIFTALISYGNSKYDNGYKAAEVDFTARQNELISEKRKEWQKQADEALAQINKDHADELQRIKDEVKTQTKIETVVKYVTEKIPVEVPGECTDITNDVIRVLVEATRIGSSTRTDSN